MGRIRWITFCIGALLAFTSPCRATSFLTEVVDPAGTGGTSLAFDSQGRPHVTYALAGSVRHAVKSGGSWISETVPGVSWSGRRSLAIGAGDQVFLAHTDWMGRLVCATKSEGIWSDEVVPTFGGIAGDAVTVDRAGSPHVLSYLGSGSLLHSVRVAGSWTSQVILSASGQPPVDMCILIDAQDRTHIAAEHFYGRWVFYSPEPWAMEIVEETPLGVRPYHSVALALDSLAQPYLAFTDYATNSLKFATRTAASDWNVAMVAGASFGLCTNLEFDNGGVPHIAYQSEGALRYLTRSGSDWANELVEAGGSSACMKLDPAGAPSIAYVGGHGVQVTRVIQADLAFAPDPFNEHRRAPWITAYLETSDFPLGSVDPSSIRLGGSVPCDVKFATLGDKDGDGIADLMVKFRTDDVLPLLAAGSNSLALTGRLVTGEEFQTQGSLRLVGAPDAAADLALRILSMPGAARVEYRVEGRPSETTRMQLFDVRGRLVRSWSDARGQGIGTWDGTGATGGRVGSGVYFLRADSGGRSVSKRVVVSH
jgi:hypothetical protein